MSPETLEYLLRLTVIWAVLIAYYFFALRRASFAVQRFYLLGTLAFGLVVPLLPTMGGSGLPIAGLPSLTYVAEPYFYTGEAVAEATRFTWSWSSVLPWLYLAGVAFFAARTLVQWKGLWRWRTSGRTDRHDGYRVIRHGGIAGPFVAFGCIFLPDGMTDADLEKTALIHETSHLRARHHYDTFLLSIASLLLWFHPLFWMLRSLLATVHEYEADAAVIQRVPVRTYGLQLLQSTLGPAGYSGLFSSPIIKRINMITSTPERKNRFFPFFALILLLGGLAVACSDVGENALTPEYEVVSGEEVPVMVPALYKDSEDLNASMKAYLTDVYQEIRYPAEARNSSTTGKFRAKVTLGIDGKIETINISPFSEELAGGPPAAETIVIIGYAEDNTLKSAAPQTDLLTKEIDRVVNLFDNWQPAVRNGRPARNTMNLDFYFRLEE